MAPQINFWAVALATVSSIVVGFLWYGPIFGKTWAGLVGIDFNQKPETGKMVRSILLNALGALFMAFVLDHGIIFGNAYLNMSGAMSGVQGAFWYWLGFFAPVTLGVVLWENKPWKLWFINAGYYLVVLLIMGAILASWM